MRESSVLGKGWVWDQLLRGGLNYDGISCCVPAQGITSPFAWAYGSLCQFWRGRADSSVWEIRQRYFCSLALGPPAMPCCERLGAAPLQEGGCLLHGAPSKAARLLCRGEGRGTPAQSWERDLGLLQMENGSKRFWSGACFGEGGERRKPDFLLPPETNAAPSADKKSRASDSWAEMP